MGVLRGRRSCQEDYGTHASSVHLNIELDLTFSSCKYHPLSYVLNAYVLDFLLYSP